MPKVHRASYNLVFKLKIVTEAEELVMHLSKLSPKWGWGFSRGFDYEVCPQGGDFDRTRYPQGGEFDMTTILDNEELLKQRMIEVL